MIVILSEAKNPVIPTAGEILHFVQDDVRIIVPHPV